MRSFAFSFQHLCPRLTTNVPLPAVQLFASVCLFICQLHIYKSLGQKEPSNQLPQTKKKAQKIHRQMNYSLLCVRHQRCALWTEMKWAS